jgi:hypothetical protein
MKLAKKEIRRDPIVITPASRNGLLTDTHAHPVAAPALQHIRSRLSKLS